MMRRIFPCAFRANDLIDTPKHSNENSNEHSNGSTMPLDSNPDGQSGGARVTVASIPGPIVLP